LRKQNERRKGEGRRLKGRWILRKVIERNKRIKQEGRVMASAAQFTRDKVASDLKIIQAQQDHSKEYQQDKATL
jgi:hypothetical protein